MRSYGTLSQKILLCHLEDTLARELRAVLMHRTLGFDVDVCPDLAESARQVKETQPRLVFCPFSQDLLALCKATLAEGRPVPAVVVSRHPDATEWLDSIEAGATDYCAAPFELPHIRWIVNTNARPHLINAA